MPRTEPDLRGVSATSPHAHAVRIVWTLTFCTALSLLGDSTLYAVLPVQYAAVGVTTVQVGWLLSVNRLVRLPLNLFSGWLSQRLGPRTPYILGLVLGALSTVGYGLCRGFWPLLAMRALWGVAWALLAVSAYGLVLDVSSETTRGRLMGTYASFFYFGGAVGAMGGGFLADALGFSRAMLILGAASSLAWLAALTLPRRRRSSESPSESVTVAERVPLRMRLRVWADVLRRIDGRLRLILVLSLIHHMLFGGVFYATFGMYLANALGKTVSFGAWVVGIASLTAILIFVRNALSVLVGPLLGHASDRLGERTRILVLGEVLGVGALASLALGGSPFMVGAGLFLAAVAYAVVPPLLLSWLGDLTANGQRGAIVGAYQTMGDLGSGLGPLAAYALADLWGLPNVYGLSALLLAVTVPLILHARSRKGWPRSNPHPLDA
ncbi:MAG: MFS transporter [Anaerolineae bacterium]